MNLEELAGWDCGKIELEDGDIHISVHWTHNGDLDGLIPARVVFRDICEPGR